MNADLNDTRLTRLPRSLTIELTKLCQLACITCPRDKPDAAGTVIGSIGLDSFVRIFDQFKAGLQTLDLTGLGESLMNQSIFDMIDYARASSCAEIYLTTNTVLLTDRTVERLKEHPVDHLCISIDGTTAAELRSVRPGLSLEKLKRRVRAAIEGLSPRTHFIMCTVLVEVNAGSMMAFVDMAAELGFKTLSLKPVNLVANPTLSNLYDKFCGPDFRAAAADAAELGKRLGVDVLVSEVGRMVERCPFPWDPIYVTWDGEVPPCCAKPFPRHYSFGNVLEQPALEVLNSEKAIAFRESHLAGDPPPFCDGCHMLAVTAARLRPR